MNYGVVAEFNPFHNGHKYLCDTLKADGESTVTAVMSGNFVQRGECACMSVTDRTKAALLSGVDLVLSLPLPFAVSSAERFAFGGVSVLESLNIIDTIAFGSECGDEEKLLACAEALASSEFNELMSQKLKEGLSYPSAREKVLFGMFGDRFSSVAASPNDTLAVEYIKALRSLSSDICVKAVKRFGAPHDSDESDGDIISASKIRSLILSGDYKKYMPKESARILLEQTASGNAPADIKKLEYPMLSALRTMEPEDFLMLSDVSEGLQNRIYEAVRTSVTIDELLEKIKTKRYTHSRLRRILLSAYLGIKSEDISHGVPYIRVLGFNGKGALLLKEAKEKATLPIVSKAAQIKKIGGEAEKMYALECKARDLFSLSLPKPDICGREMTDGIIIID